MRLSSSSVPSSKWRKNGQSGPRLRKKHKRLDAICEREYNENHGESNDGDDGAGTIGGEEVRRSSRVRKTPVILDASPPPPKKRQRTDKNAIRERGKKSCSNIVCGDENENLEELEIPGSWVSRLRSRGKGAGYGKKKGSGLPWGKKNLFEEMGEKKVAGVKLDRKEGELETVKPTVVKPKHSERIKSLSVFADGKKESDSLGTKYENDKSEVEAMGIDGKECMQRLENESDSEDENETVEGNDKQENGEEERDTSNSLQSEDGLNGNINVDTTQQIDAALEQSEHVKGGEDQRDLVEVVATPANQVEATMGLDERDECVVKVDEKLCEEDNVVKVDKSKSPSINILRKPRIKEGRHCGLCGGGTDGKPPKKIAPDMGDSENEAYSGTSPSEEPNYDMWDGFGDEPGWLGRLLGPINDRFGIAGTWVHQHCAVWSPEVYFAGLGCLKNVRAALCRGRALKCSRCGRPGATIGCRVDRCPKTYHLPCARANGCIFDHRKFLIACTDHRHLFQPHGNQYLHQIKKMKVKKLKLEIRKSSNDASRKDIEAEEKWLENCGEDEEFLKRESKRLHRDLLRIAPVHIGGTDSENGKLFQGWESVAGLQDVIRCLKEVVILPLLYPEFFNSMGLTPPRGVLLHGYPGTGKTLVVRALIGSCARGDKRIAYFARKGADCLGKYVGDAERQLRLLFQVAEKCQPSIIFFDEIDGLAPCRTKQQDQTHNSVVSTLLALLDGLKSRGSVVVIGATNRPDAVDPALRRPGRFDREIYFPLPSVDDRASILSLHTQRWPKPVTGSLLKWVASKTVGYAGADLQALCTQAAMIALKRSFPLQETLSAAEERARNGQRVPLPAFAVEECDWLDALACASPPCSHREAGMAAKDVVTSSLPAHLIPCLLKPLSVLIISLYLDEHLWLPPSLYKAGKIIKSVMVSALDKKRLPCDSWWLHVDDFLQDEDFMKEIMKKLSYVGIVIGRSIFSECDAFEEDNDADNEKFLPSILHHGIARNGNVSIPSRKRSGYRILVSGNPRLGQRHLASCLLHCYVGHVEIQKLDLATISQEGHGDVLLGISQILRTCATVGSCIVFMPRIDLWAVESHQKTGETDYCLPNDDCSENKDSRFTSIEEDDSCRPQCEVYDSEDSHCSGSVSYAWHSFVEQVEFMCVSTCLMILATSEVPYPQLPDGIREFFKISTLNCGKLIPLEHTIPRFSVQLDGNFNNGMVVGLSVAELSRDIIQKSIQLIHKKMHTKSSCKAYETCGAPKINTDDASRDANEGSALEHLVKTRLPDNSFHKSSLLPNNRNVKGKSSLQLAISSLGYQILRYPHFAELSWATSKLKEGPCSDTNGPWKGWPFNSCIVRPWNSSLEKLVVALDSRNVKSKERCGLVRGLIAVGLLAYRGVYTSVREVTVEIRKVLELLAGKIHAKIQAGKDRYRYVRLLSQVAYLEDMVNNWAYALQSSELDAQMVGGSPKVTTVGCPDNHDITMDNPVQGKEFQPNVAHGNSHESKFLKDSSFGFATENIDCVDLNKRDGDLCYSNIEERLEIPENISAENFFPFGCSVPDNDVQSSAAADQLDGKTLNVQNGTVCRTTELVNTTDNGIPDGNNETLRHSSGSASADSVVLSEDGYCNPGAFCGAKLSGSGKVSNHINGIPLVVPEIIPTDDKLEGDEQSEDPILSRNTTVHSTESGVVCLYRCCSECISILHDVIQKFINREWSLNKNIWKVEAIHDVLALLSVNLLSVVNKVYTAENLSSSADGRSLTHEKWVEHPEFKSCQCKHSGDGLSVPAECSCHSKSRCGMAASTSLNTQFGFDLNLSFRDGVLVPLDSHEDVSFHCKFESLCLCSLIELIASTKLAI